MRYHRIYTGDLSPCTTISNMFDISYMTLFNERKVEKPPLEDEWLAFFEGHLIIENLFNSDNVCNFPEGGKVILYKGRILVVTGDMNEYVASSTCIDFQESLQLIHEKAQEEYCIKD